MLIQCPLSELGSGSAKWCMSQYLPILILRIKNTFFSKQETGKHWDMWLFQGTEYKKAV